MASLRLLYLMLIGNVFNRVCVCVCACAFARVYVCVGVPPGGGPPVNRGAGIVMS